MIRKNNSSKLKFNDAEVGRQVQKQDYSLVFWLVMSSILIILIGLPLFWLALRSLQQPDASLSFNNYLQIFTKQRLVSAIANSLILATGVGIMSTLLGVPMAWAVTRTNMPLAGLVKMLLLVAFAMPPFLGGVAWILLAAPNSGWLNRVFVSLTGAESGIFNVYSMLGAIFVVGLYSYPYSFILVSSALESMTGDLEDAARILGAGKFTVASAISLPLVLPAIVSGFLLSFLEAIALFGSPTLLLIPARIPIITSEIWQQFQYPPQIELASALSMCSIAIAVVLLWLQRFLLAGKDYTILTGKGSSKQLLDIGKWRFLFLIFCLLVSTLSLFLPCYMLMRTSLSKAWGQPFTPANMTMEWYADLFKLPFTQISIANSLLYSAAAAVLTMFLGVSVAYITTNKSVWGWRIFSFLPIIPLAIPGIALAVGIFAAYSRPPLVLYGTGLILIVAYTTRFLPVAYSNASNVFGTINREIELAARNLGATQLQTLAYITVPLVRRGLLGGLILVFTLSVRELSCAILLASSGTQVMPTVLFELMNEGSLERVAALSVVMLVLIFTSIALLYRLVGRDFKLKNQL